jgi:putative tryptophan/tyrosine transport system substrate-binding protein
MSNKTFYLALSALLFVLCFPVQAQQAKKIPRIGYLSLRASHDIEPALKQRLRDLGWVEGQNMTIEYRWAGNNVDRLPGLAKDLVDLKVDVILASSTPVIRAVKNTTTTIPIVMMGAADPVGIGFVASLARPGGNITGLSLQSPELSGKRLELLNDIVPKLNRVAFLAYGRDPAHRLFVKEAQEAAESLKVRIQLLVLGNLEEIEGAFSKMVRERAEALVIQPLFIGGLGQGRRLVELAAKNHLPTVSDGTQFAEIGGLIYYGPNRIELFRRAAVYVDKILKGAKPADLPVEQPTKFELVINLKTAKQLGVTIPQSVLFRADRVIK